MKTAVLAGATGLIGSAVLDLMLRDGSYFKVIALSRKPLHAKDPKLLNLVVDFEKLADYASQLKADDVYCCLGTTIKQAGSKEAFRKVDLDYPVSLAATTLAQGAGQFLLVSAMGAKRDSSIFYNQVKGEVQDRIQALHFKAFHIFQPSLLVGPRATPRLGERVAAAMVKAFQFAVPKKYQPIESVRVARAMLAVAHHNKSGKFIYTSDVLQGF